MTYSWATVISCLVLTLCVGLVVIGGIKRIAKVSAGRGAVYGGICMSVLAAHYHLLTNITGSSGRPIVTIVKSQHLPEAHWRAV